MYIVTRASGVPPRRARYSKEDSKFLKICFGSLLALSTQRQPHLFPVHAFPILLVTLLVRLGWPGLVARRLFFSIPFCPLFPLRRHG